MLPNGFVASGERRAGPAAQDFLFGGKVVQVVGEFVRYLLTCRGATPARKVERENRAWSGLYFVAI